MPNLNEVYERAIKAAGKSRAVVVEAHNLLGVNPLMAANKIKSVAFDAADVARENAEIALHLAGLMREQQQALLTIKNELKSRGLISS